MRKLMVFIIAIMLLNAAVYAQNKSKIAVYVTSSEDVAENEKKALGTSILSSLVNSERYVTIERSNAFLAKIDEEQKRQRSGAIDENQIIRLGKQFGVEFICIADITPAFGAYQISARIVDVETAEVVYMGKSSSRLRSMEDLSKVSDEVVGIMFKTQITPKLPTTANTPHQQQIINNQYAPKYKDFTGIQRWGTFGLNWLIPGVGSFTIMKDNVGGWIQAVSALSGYIMMFNGFDTYEEQRYGYYGTSYTETYTEPNGWLWTGYGLLLFNFGFNIYRSASYHKPVPKSASSCTDGFNFAVLPNQNGDLKAKMQYNLSF
ncbi:MAG: CsgG/HfaB family protein [Chitinispirillales bacterium]|jgi:hypothetical protein|nr:CsgG/HfaB family protein [Chitinispirillales bacterium]